MEQQKKITKVSVGWGGHLHLSFEDHSKLVLHRLTHETPNLKPGDLWPPTPETGEADGEAQGSGA